MKLKHFISGMCDILFIFGAISILFTMLENCIVDQYATLFFKIILNILLCYIYINKDVLFKNRTFGKRVFKLCIVSKKNNLPIYENKVFILRNSINLITILILYILFCVSLAFNLFILFVLICTIIIVKSKETLGDYFCKTKIANYKYHDIYNSKNINDKKIKLLNGILCIAIYCIIYIYVIIYQPINYYTYDILNIPFTILVFYIIIKLFSKKICIKNKIYSLILIIIVSVLNNECEIKLTNYYNKFSTISSSFFYSYPKSDLVQIYEYDDFAFIVFQKEDNLFAQVCTVKKNDDKWEYIEPTKELDDIGKKIYNYSGQEYVFIVVSQNGSNIVLLNSNVIAQKDDIIDSYGNHFEKIINPKDGERYFYITTFTGTIDDDYVIYLNEMIIEPI